MLSSSGCNWTARTPEFRFVTGKAFQALSYAPKAAPCGRLISFRLLFIRSSSKSETLSSRCVPYFILQTVISILYSAFRILPERTWFSSALAIKQTLWSALSCWRSRIDSHLKNGCKGHHPLSCRCWYRVGWPVAFQTITRAKITSSTRSRPRTALRVIRSAKPVYVEGYLSRLPFSVGFLIRMIGNYGAVWYLSVHSSALTPLNLLDNSNAYRGYSCERSSPSVTRPVFASIEWARWLWGWHKAYSVCPSLSPSRIHQSV